MRRICLAVALAAACGDGKPPPAPPAKPKPPEPKASAIPDRVTYDQILIVFKDSFQRPSPDKTRMIVQVNTERTREEARSLARSLFERAQAGVDFEALKQEYSDDRDANGRARGPTVTVKDRLRREPAEIPMSSLGTQASEVVYRLAVGEVGIVEHDERLFPDGWLVVKRLQ